MRSVVKLANEAGIGAVLDQQFEYAREILAAGLVPIIEPEVDIHSPEKAEAEVILRDGIARRLAELPAGQRVMLKLTIPSVDGFYADFVTDPHILRVVALSGGYTRAEACAMLAKNPGVVASFSRALTQGLTAQQSTEEFDAMLDAAIEEIFQASTAA
jgi:fructose-bisphosphate aldolase class I